MSVPRAIRTGDGTVGPAARRALRRPQGCGRFQPSSNSGPPRAPVNTPTIRVGIGGWLYEPWRDNFYPAGLPHKRELEYASRRVTAIEIDSTYYRLQKPESFARWREETPEDFVFSLKATMFCTNRKVL